MIRLPDHSSDPEGSQQLINTFGRLWVASFLGCLILVSVCCLIKANEIYTTVARNLIIRKEKSCGFIFSGAALVAERHKDNIFVYV